MWCNDKITYRNSYNSDLCLDNVPLEDTPRQKLDIHLLQKYRKAYLILSFKPLGSERLTHNFTSNDSLLRLYARRICKWLTALLWELFPWRGKKKCLLKHVETKFLCAIIFSLLRMSFSSLIDVNWFGNDQKLVRWCAIYVSRTNCIIAFRTLEI